MSIPNTNATRIAVIGLGYVGLPLALHMARHFETVGYDIDGRRVSELREAHDATGETPASELRATALHVTDDAADLEGNDIYLVTVPTPVDDDNRPDLSGVLSACDSVGGALRSGAVVVFESTVYPGVTEEICGPALERVSGLVCGRDFFLGYSPERINPGDSAHAIDKITKVIAGQTSEVTDLLAAIYGAITEAGVFRAADIRTAEAAKVIENAQRDINIAFVNEIAVIFDHLGLNTRDILTAARTKWNFLDFQPGLVGGHCIDVDPYYLAHAAEQHGYHPRVILSGRRINDDMAAFCAERIDAELRARVTGGGDGRVLVLGLTFKENVPDLRNARSVDMIRALEACGHRVDDAVVAAGGVEPGQRLQPVDDCGLAQVGHGVVGVDAVAARGLHRLQRQDAVGPDPRGWPGRRPQGHVAPRGAA